MTRKRRRFSQEFKVEAVRMIIDGGSSIAALARDLGVSANGLRRWKKQYEADAQEAFSGNGRVHSRDEELRRLQREVVVLRQERDILKKATMFFASESRWGAPLSKLTGVSLRSG